MILPQGENFTILKNRLKCVLYFNSLSSQTKEAQQPELQQEFRDLWTIYEASKGQRALF
jgi:hypothetical protein